MQLQLAESVTPLQIDRWLLNHVFRRQRVFSVKLSDCIDEFGNSYGKDGDHHFVQALKRGEDADSVASYLREYYASHPIRSFNEVVGRDIGKDAGAKYFCPWEAGRIRPLAKFAFSHKVGPTPEEAIGPIVRRLLGVLESVCEYGLRTWVMLDGYPRGIEVVNQQDDCRYLIRDGNHRIAVLSHLGWKTLKVCYEDEHWQASRLFLWFHQLTSGRAASAQKVHPRQVREDQVAQWPHVRDGLVSPDDALKYFQEVYGRSFGVI